MKKYWVIAGVVLLAVGLIVFLFPHVETVKQETVATTLEPGESYLFEPFSAGAQHWVDLDISASNLVNLQVDGQIYKDIFSLRGRLFQYKVSFQNYDAYQVEVYNPSWAQISVNITGSVYVRHIPGYLYPLRLTDSVRANGIGLPIVFFGLGITIIGLLKARGKSQMITK